LIPTRSQLPASSVSPNAWWLVLCLVGIDYFSTLAYLPSIAVEAAGPLAPVATLLIVLVTLLMALPIYSYVVGRSPHGQGATGLLDRTIRGWRGKMLVLALMGFIAADFVVTRSLSVADASTHVIHNPHWQNAVTGLTPAMETVGSWLVTSRWERIRPHFTQQMVLAIGLSVLVSIFWFGLKGGFARKVLILAAVAVSIYLLLTAIVIGCGLSYIVTHTELIQHWVESVRDWCAEPTVAATNSAGSSRLSVLLLLALVSFPQMALGISGFELSMATAPWVAGEPNDDPDHPRGRIHSARKLMCVATAIMSIYLVGSVTVTTLLIAPSDLIARGPAQHRALAYLAHGGVTTTGESAAVLSGAFGEYFGSLYDLSTVLILCLAGASVMMSLRSLVPQYLHKTGMELDWANRAGVTMHLSNLIIVIVTMVFRASVSAQQWAYATSVLVLLSGASIAAVADLRQRWQGSRFRPIVLAPFTLICVFFLGMAGLTIFVNRSGLIIALVFVVALLVTSFVSRWIRSTELRFQGFAFADEQTRARWDQICGLEFEVLVPHRPGRFSLQDKDEAIRRKHRLPPEVPIIFIEAEVGDPSDFYQMPLMRIEREHRLEVIRVSRCVSVSHVIAAIGLEFARVGRPPEIIFGWSHERPMAANLSFLLFGEGNIPWMVQELVRRAQPDPAKQPRIVVG
jgi:hypothetical protein